MNGTWTWTWICCLVCVTPALEFHGLMGLVLRVLESSLPQSALRIPQHLASKDLVELTFLLMPILLNTTGDIEQI